MARIEWLLGSSAAAAAAAALTFAWFAPKAVTSEGFLQPAPSRAPDRMRRTCEEWADAVISASRNAEPGIPPQGDMSMSPEAVISDFAAWLSDNPEAAMRWFSHVAPDSMSGAMLSALAEIVGRQPLDRIGPHVAEIQDSQIRLAICQSAVNRWIREHPERVADLIANTTSGQDQRNLLGQVVPPWSQQNLSAASQWVRRLPEGPSKHTAFVHLSYEWTKASPVEAANAAVASAAANPQFLALVAAQWAEFQAEAAAAWALALPESAAKEKALVSVASVWARQNPRIAAEFITRIPLQAQQEAGVAVASAWSQSSPQDAALWAQQIPAGEAREHALENVFARWIDADPLAAVRTAGTLSRPGERDAAIRAAASRLVASDPDLAVRLASAITDETKRNQLLESAAAAWLTKEAGPAVAWLEGSSLPAATKQRLLHERRL
jgi:hypothetical protein